MALLHSEGWGSANKGANMAGNTHELKATTFVVTGPGLKGKVAVTAEDADFGKLLATRGNKATKLGNAGDEIAIGLARSLGLAAKPKPKAKAQKPDEDK